jgi:acyl-CoA thioester hydrolase
VSATNHAWPAPAAGIFRPKLRPRRGVYTARVLYQDTDRAKIVHHSAYFRYLEGARLELWRAHGFDYRRFEEETGLGLPVAEARIRYRNAARFDDELVVETWTSAASRASLWLDAVVRRDSLVLVESSVRLACVSFATGTVRRIPDELLDACLEPGHGI